VYRLYPNVAEADALQLWWPWGRIASLSSSPPRPGKSRLLTLDPSIITAKRPDKIVADVMAQTGMNRTTAQRLTPELRQKQREARRLRAQMLLNTGMTKAEVARTVGLSASRISAMFPDDDQIRKERARRKQRDRLAKALEDVRHG